MIPQDAIVAAQTLKFARSVKLLPDLTTPAPVPISKGRNRFFAALVSKQSAGLTLFEATRIVDAAASLRPGSG